MSLGKLSGTVYTRQCHMSRRVWWLLGDSALCMSYTAFMTSRFFTPEQSCNACILVSYVATIVCMSNTISLLTLRQWYTNTYIIRYSMMMWCWKIEPGERPSFSTLVETLSKSLEDMADYLHVGTFTNLNNFSTGQAEQDPPEWTDTPYTLHQVTASS